MTKMTFASVGSLCAGMLFFGVDPMKVSAVTVALGCAARFIAAADIEAETIKRLWRAKTQPRTFDPMA